MIISSVISVFLSWYSGRDTDKILPELDQCGAVPTELLSVMDWEELQNYVFTLNESWRNGFAVTVMSLGPFVHAVCVFLLVRTEIEAKLVGVLRGLGVRESVYWMGWLVPFTLSSFVNSMLAAIAASFIPVHVFQTVYFGGIFGSLFFLNLALTCASLFLAALCGENRKVIILMIIAMAGVLFVPWVLLNQSLYYLSVNDLQYQSTDGSPGLVWAHLNTTHYDTFYNYTNGYDEPSTAVITSCEVPILSEETGTLYKTVEERLDVAPEELFLGCHVRPGYTSNMWNPDRHKFGIVPLFMIPYFHFMTLFANFLGFTGMPDNAFGAREASMSPEDLAMASLPNLPNDAHPNGADLFPQGSTLRTHGYYDDDAMDQYFLRNGGEYSNYYGWSDPNGITIPYPNVCPSQDLPGFNFCDYMRCSYVKESKAFTGSPSVHDTFGYLFALSCIYVLMAAYWLQVFPAGNGAPRKCYFFLDPTYWMSSGSNQTFDGAVNGVSITNVSKSFGSVQAVKDLTLELKRGQVTALLGHNGAGKSTLTNILSCDMAASRGEVSIFGNTAKLDPFAVRCLVGICKQDDFLWSDLSAKEHLDIFAGLRGVHPDNHDGIVHKWLESVDLLIDQHKFSGTFSGGMKRRLSVALSTIGDRPFLIFDEPTTGMDPVSRRIVWQHLDDIKKNRVVLLTTHAMEEADLLADEVAIMKNGKLAANGSPLELKAGYGSAIQFSILVEKEDVTMTEQRIKNMFMNYLQCVSIIASDTGSIMVKIDKIQNEPNSQHEGVPISNLSEFVAWLESNESKVCEYGFSNSSLEEVFINITRDGDPVAEIDAGNELSASSAEIAIPVDIDAGIDIITSQPTMNIQSQVEAMLRLSIIRKWLGRKAIIEYACFGVMIVGTIVLGLGIPSLSQVGLFQVIPILALSFMLLSIIFPIYLDNTSGIYQFMVSHGLSLSSFTTAIGIYAFHIQLVFGFILLTLYFLTPLFRETQFCEQITYMEESCNNLFDALTETYNENCNEYSYQKQSCYPSGFGQVYRAEGQKTSQSDLRYARSPGGYGSICMIGFGFALLMPGAVFASSIVPGNYKFAMVVVGFVTLIACVSPIVYAVLSLDEVNRINDEKYYGDVLTNITDPLTECINLIDPEGLCSSNWTSLPQESHLNCIGIDLFSQSLELVSLLSLCAPKYASLLPQFGAFQMLVATLLDRIKIDGIIFDNDDHCSGDAQQVCKFPFAQRMYNQHSTFFFLGTVLLNIVGLCLFVLVWSPTSKRSNLKEHVEVESEEFARQEVIDEKAAVEDIIRPLLVTPDIDAVEAANVSNVTIDYKAKSESSSLPSVLMHKLRKVYPASGKNPQKIALNALDLHVTKGQVCALLGKNGSGKTTALKILATSHPASSGLALVDGYDVKFEKRQVFMVIGNCPQHDIIWPSLSVKEHLEFFARLKGIPRGDIQKSSRALARAVGLGTTDVYHRAAGVLSGGMRRRLSIAISLTGAPSVLLLDEPTTGLDPSTRNEIWNLISSFATEERAVIITTHQMIEADTLCNRIAIIADGKLRVVSTQQHLKDKYGVGYVLQLNLVQSSEEYIAKAMTFVKQHLHPEAVLDIKQAKTLHIHLPKDINLDKVFAALYSPERSTEGCINQFLLSQSSLEDVFIALGS